MPLCPEQIEKLTVKWLYEAEGLTNLHTAKETMQIESFERKTFKGPICHKWPKAKNCEGLETEKGIRGTQCFWAAALL